MWENLGKVPPGQGNSVHANLPVIILEAISTIVPQVSSRILPAFVSLFVRFVVELCLLCVPMFVRSGARCSRGVRFVRLVAWFCVRRAACLLRCALAVHGDDIRIATRVANKEAERKLKLLGEIGLSL